MVISLPVYPTSFTISICYSKDVKCKENKYFCYKGDYYWNLLIDKMEVLSVLANYSGKMKTVCYFCYEKFVKKLEVLKLLKLLFITVIPIILEVQLI